MVDGIKYVFLKVSGKEDYALLIAKGQDFDGAEAQQALYVEKDVAAKKRVFRSLKQADIKDPTDILIYQGEEIEIDDFGTPNFWLDQSNVTEISGLQKIPDGKQAARFLTKHLGFYVPEPEGP